MNEPRIRHTERDDGGGPPRWLGMAQVIRVIGIVVGGIGFIGGLFPAARAATMPVTTAPREL